MGQHRPLRWPVGRWVDWVDGHERAKWVAELRDHIFDMFVTALDRTRRHPLMGSRKQARESILASKEAIGELMFLAGAPREIWRDVDLSLPAPTFDEPPEQGRGADDPFAEVARGGCSFEEQRKWLGYIEGQIEYLASLALGAYPESSFEHRRARWTAIRLRVLLNRRLCRLGLQAL